MKLIKMNEQDVKNQFKKQPFSSFPVSHYFMHFFPTQMQSLKLGPLFLTDIFTGKAAHGVNKHQLISLFFVCLFFLIQRLEFNHRLAGTIYSFFGINNEFRLRANEQVMSSLKGFLINK